MKGGEEEMTSPSPSPSPSPAERVGGGDSERPPGPYPPHRTLLRFENWEEEYDHWRHIDANKLFYTNSKSFYVRQEDLVTDEEKVLANFAVDEIQRITGRDLQLIQIIKRYRINCFNTVLYMTLKLRDVEEEAEKVYRAKVRRTRPDGGKELLYFDELVTPLEQAVEVGIDNKPKVIVEYRGAWGVDEHHTLARNKVAIMEEERKKREEEEDKKSRKRARFEQPDDTDEKMDEENKSKSIKKKKKTKKNDVAYCSFCHTLAKHIVDCFNSPSWQQPAELVEIINLTRISVSYFLTLKLRVYGNVERVYRARFNPGRKRSLEKIGNTGLVFTEFEQVVEPPNQGSKKRQLNSRRPGLRRGYKMKKRGKDKPNHSS